MVMKGKMIKEKKCEVEVKEETKALEFNGDVLFEVLKRVDARTLGKAACVSKNWNRAAMDDQVWEILCTPYLWKNCSKKEIRSVVREEEMGGFRCIYLKNIWCFLKNGWESELSPYVLVTFITRTWKDEKEVVKRGVGLSLKEYLDIQTMNCPLSYSYRE